MIIKSQDIDDVMTHNVPNIYVNRVLNRKFRKYKCASKPHGIWISLNNSWEKFCEESLPSKMINTTQFQVKLFKNLNILMIENFEELEKLWYEFTNIPVLRYDYDENYIPLIENFWDFIELKNIHGVGLTNQAIAETKETFLFSWDCESIVMFDSSNIILRQNN